MNAQTAQPYLGIGEVLAQLRAEFPDIRVSKIRFLESEGLIAPARSPSGYRRFGPAEVEQLRAKATQTVDLQGHQGTAGAAAGRCPASDRARHRAGHRARDRARERGR